MLDKAAAVLAALQDGPLPLAGLTERTGLPRATAYRLATALGALGLVRADDGAFGLGPWLSELGALAGGDRLLARAQPVLDALRDETGCSAQLYRPAGPYRACIAASDVPSGLRDTVPVGTLLPMTAGSAAQVLLADEGVAPPGSAFTAATLAAVRRRDWAQSVAERAVGVASVSAPVRDAAGAVIAAVSVSGPVSLLGRSPGRRHAPAVRGAAAALTAVGSGCALG